MPKDEKFEPYRPPAEQKREDGRPLRPHGPGPKSKSKAKSKARPSPQPTGASRSKTSRTRARSEQRPTAEQPMSPRRRTMLGWAAGIVVPPLLVLGSIILFGWGGGWSSLTGHTHPMNAKIVGTHRVGDCGKHDVYDKIRLELEWRVDGSMRTGHYDQCFDGTNDDFRYATGKTTTVWLDGDGEVASDEGPWFVRTLAGVFTVSGWAALIWMAIDRRRKRRH